MPRGDTDRSPLMPPLHSTATTKPRSVELTEVLVALDDIIDNRRIRSVFQPIVELDDLRVVGYEALARGPEGSSLESPPDLFSSARSADRLADLCFTCRWTGLERALESDLRDPLTLFLNIEPEALDHPMPRDLLDLFDRVQDQLRIVVEITERAVASRPAELLRSVQCFRERGWGIALDDVGADRHSLALMPFLRPDVVKLDLRLVQQRPSVEIAEIVNAVSAEVERSGAVVLAEGIETDAHLVTAVAMGASLGQGWLFGRPGPLPTEPPAATGRAIAVVGAARFEPEATPVGVLRGQRSFRTATKGHLVAVSRHLEDQADSLGEAAVLLSCFQTRARFTRDTRRRYSEVAEQAAFVAAFGSGMGEDPAPGVRGARIESDDTLVEEWDVVVVSPHFAALLAARDLGDDGPDLERRFEFVVTYDRDIVIEAANVLLSRIAPVLPAEEHEAAIAA